MKVIKEEFRIEYRLNERYWFSIGVYTSLEDAVKHIDYEQEYRVVKKTTIEVNEIQYV